MTQALAIALPVALIEPTMPVDRRPTGCSARFWTPRLAEHLCVPESRIIIESPPGERPAARIDNRPVSLSFSRTTGARACVIRLDGPIGVDIERVRPMPELDGMIALSLTAAETARLESRPTPDRTACFLECWTRKEAVLKAAGCGLRIDPRCVHTDPPNAEPGSALLGPDLYLTRVERIGGLVVAVATPA